MSSSMTFKGLSQLSFHPCCAILSVQTHSLLTFLSVARGSKDTVILKHLYKETIDTLKQLQEISDINKEMRRSVNHGYYQTLDQLVVRHGMSTENVLMHIMKSNSIDFNIELLLKQQIKISILLQKLNDILKMTKPATIPVPQTIRLTNLLQLCSDASKEVENLAELTYNVSPEIDQRPPFRPQPLIESAVKTQVTPQKQKSSERLEAVFTIPSLVRFVVVELLKNAVHATIQKRISQREEEDNNNETKIGSLGLESERDHLSTVRVELSSTTNEFSLSVIDSGVGMTASQIANSDLLYRLNQARTSASPLLEAPSNFLLDRNVSYQPVTSPFQGLGVGLMLSRLYVEFLGGSLTVESAGPGTGTSVKCRMPLDPELIIIT